MFLCWEPLNVYGICRATRASHPLPPPHPDRQHKHLVTHLTAVCECFPVHWPSPHAFLLRVALLLTRAGGEHGTSLDSPSTGEGLVVTRAVVERRAVAIIRCIVDMDLRMEATLSVLRAAIVPYISEVYQLSQDALTWTGSLLNEVGTAPLWSDGVVEVSCARVLTALQL